MSGVSWHMVSGWHRICDFAVDLTCVCDVLFGLRFRDLDTL